MKSVRSLTVSAALLIVPSLFAALLASVALAQEPIQSSQKPEWSFDLQNSPAYAARMERVRKAFSPHLPRPQLAFLSADTLAVSFADGSWQDYQPETPRGFFHFRAFFIDTAKSTLTGPTLSWPTPDDDSILLPLSDGGFVTLACKHLVRYSSDFSVVRQASVPADPGNEGPEFANYGSTAVYQIEYWRAQEDPKGQVVVLSHYGPAGTSYFWISPESLSVAGMAKDRDAPSVAGTKDVHAGAILPASRAIAAGPWTFPTIAYDDGAWQTFCPLVEAFSMAIFANEDKFFAEYSSHQGVRYALVDNRCRILLDLPGIYSNGELGAVSRAGNRIAIGERSPLYTSVFSRAIRVKLILRIWDLDRPREIERLTLSQRKSGIVVTGMDDFAIALSPDGKTLAVLIDATLMLYSI